MAFNNNESEMKENRTAFEGKLSQDSAGSSIVNTQSIPHHLDIEQSVLGALLFDNSCYDMVGDFLKSEHFYLPLHQRIFELVGELMKNSKVANPITLAPLLEGHYMETDVKKYLVDLAVLIVGSQSLADYGQQILDAYMRRRLMRLGQSIIEQAGKPHVERDAFKQIEEAEQKLFDLAVNGDLEKKNTRFQIALGQAVESAHKAFNKSGHIVGVTTGFYELDKCMGGLHNSDLIIVAGRPSMGKTALAVNIAFNAASAHMDNLSEGAKVLFFSLEMSSEQLAMRILGQESGISSDRIRRGAVNARDFQNFEEVQRKMESLPMFIDDTPALSLSALRTRARRLSRQEKIGMIIIDYLQLLSGGGNHNENRVQELSALTRGLKALAKELNVPIIAVSQLSRAVEQREDKHPQLSDLRESGTIEQDADIVMFVYREAYYVARKKPSEGSPKMDEWQREMAQVHGQATLMIAKQRHGPIKNITLHYNEALTKFDNYAIDSSK